MKDFLSQHEVKHIRKKAGATRREAIEIEAELRAKYRKGEFNPFEKPRGSQREEFSEQFLMSF